MWIVFNSNGAIYGSYTSREKAEEIADMIGGLVGQIKIVHRAREYNS